MCHPFEALRHTRSFSVGCGGWTVDRNPVHTTLQRCDSADEMAEHAACGLVLGYVGHITHGALARCGRGLRLVDVLIAAVGV